MNIEYYDGNISNELVALMTLADPNEDSIRAYLDQARLLVARNEDEILAVAAIIINRDTAEIRNIAVKSNYQGQGIGKSLIEQTKILAKEFGAKALVIGTGNSSLNQLALYQKCGFRIFDIFPDYFANYPEPIIENGIRCLDMLMLKCEL